jgi:uncharacterized protein YjaG (DUF416 family)
MFPNLHEMKDAIASNTETQQELLRVLTELNKNVIELSKQLKAQITTPAKGPR